MRRLIRLVVGGAALAAVAKAVGVLATSVVGERLDPETAEFSVAAIVAGRQYVSVAPSLRRGQVVVVMGGADVDLREAIIDPYGADVRVRVVAGGVRLLLSPDWRVELESDIEASAAQVNLPDPSGDEAPHLRLEVVARAAACVIDVESRPSHTVRQS